MEPSKLRLPEYRGSRSSLGRESLPPAASPDSTRFEAAGSGRGSMNARHKQRDSGAGVGSASNLGCSRDRFSFPAPQTSLLACQPDRDIGEACGSSSGQGGSGRGGHIRVAVRVRPLPPGDDGIIEVAGEQEIAIRKNAATGGNEFLKSQQGRVEERVFDRVFGGEATQREVYSWSCSPLVQEAIARGRSATVFVYGATGAGKTHTMFGGNGDEQRGIIFRAIPEVFNAVDLCTQRHGDPDSTFEVKVSFLEIYNETVRDLLQTDATAAAACRVLEDAQRGLVKVSNLMEPAVHSPEEALWYLQAGINARTVEATAANSQSSRSHAVFTLTIERVRHELKGHGSFSRRRTEVRQLHSKISLIDLAGSERAAITQNTGSALKDGARINQSLLALANCIDALTARSREQVAATPRKKPPYRDSKLTLMLKGSLTGNALVAMIANVHPGRSHFEDSNNTLEYASRASTVRSTSSRRLSKPASGMVVGTWVPPISPVEDHCISEEPASPTSLDASAPPASRRKRRPASRLVDGGHKRDHADLTTASSPEDCVSEISLSSHGGVESETSPDSSNMGNASRSFDYPSKASGQDEVFSEQDDAEEGDDDTCPDEDEEREALRRPQGVDEEASSSEGREVCYKTWAPHAGSGHRGSRMAPGCTPPTPPATETLAGIIPAEADGVKLAAQIVTGLRLDKARLQERLTAMTNERDALFQERRAVEEENAALWTANLEKDRQIEMLVARLASQ